MFLRSVSKVNRCALQERLKEVAEEPVQSEVISVTALGTYEKREVTLCKLAKSSEGPASLELWFILKFNATILKLLFLLMSCYSAITIHKVY